METESTTREGLRVQAHRDRDVAYLELDGFIDPSTAGYFKTQAETQITGGARSLVLGASRLTFIDSSGLNVIVQLTEALRPGGGTVTYDVIRDGRVIATTSSATRTYTDPDATAGSRYTVRSVDGRGNRSASPAPKAA